MPNNTAWLLRNAFYALGRSKLDRSKANVLGEYSASWESFARHLDKCKTLDEWLYVRGLEDKPAYYNVGGRLSYQAFDSNDFNRRKLLAILRKDFPNIQSVTEYGCGLGRNLLFLKQQMPHLEVFGYELCQPGVDIAKRAAEKFGLDVQYSQLDYVSAPERDYVFPATDVAFTMYSLEQLPKSNRTAVQNILAHTKCASIHIEPVPENYPLTLRGLVGRLDHYKADYLKDFDRNVRALNLASVTKEAIDSAHNPLMFPSAYVLRKS